MLQKYATNVAILACTSADGGASGVLRLKNRFTVSRTGETGVLWFRFRANKEIPA